MFIASKRDCKTVNQIPLQQGTNSDPQQQNQDRSLCRLYANSAKPTTYKGSRSAASNHPNQIHGRAPTFLASPAVDSRTKSDACRTFSIAGGTPAGAVPVVVFDLDVDNAVGACNNKLSAGMAMIATMRANLPCMRYIHHHILPPRAAKRCSSLANPALSTHAPVLLFNWRAGLYLLPKFASNRLVQPEVSMHFVTCCDFSPARLWHRPLNVFFP